METLVKIKNRKPLHIQADATTTLCGVAIKETSELISSSEVTCGRCIKIRAWHEPQTEKTCTVCGATKPIDEFYYNSATDSLMSKCMKCQSRFAFLSRKYKQEGRKLTTKEFREKGLYKRDKKELVKA